MANHYHLVIETPDGNLARGMRQLNGVYTQYSNRRHQQTGHVFQGRYKAILVDGDSYLLELSRYVVLNPVRAGEVEAAGDWPWSSYGAMVKVSERPPWLAVDGLLAQFAERRATAVRRYRRFVAAGVGAESIWHDVNRQIFLGDDEFVTRMQEKLVQGQSADVNISAAQRRAPALPLASFAARFGDRDRAIIAAYETGQYSYQDIASYYGLHFTTVGRIVRSAKKGRS